MCNIFPMHQSAENLDTEVYSAMGKEHEIFLNLENIKAATRNFHDDNKLGERGIRLCLQGNITLTDHIKYAIKLNQVTSSFSTEQQSTDYFIENERVGICPEVTQSRHFNFEFQDFHILLEYTLVQLLEV